MKVLILTVSAGHGHNSTASAVEAVFTENGHECKKIDIGYEASKLVGFVVDKGYLFLVNHLAGFYSKNYTKQLKREVGKKDWVVIAAKYVSKKLRKQILDFAPDIIICTHVAAGMILNPMLRDGEIRAKTYGILTDFTLHPYWEDVTHLDYVVIPCEELAEQCIKKGFKPEQILPIGIPIQKKFSERLEKEAARESLGLMTDKPVVTVMSGSMCYGGLTDTVKALDNLNECFQIVAVCGSSKKELEKLNQMKFRHKILKLGFTEQVNVIMDASDCIITKPGGLSTSEALSRKLPMILSTPIPGHEERNLKFLCDSGAALAITETNTADKLLQRFLSDENLKASMCEAAEKVGRFRAAEALYEFICDKKELSHLGHTEKG